MAVEGRTVHTQRPCQRGIVELAANGGDDASFGVHLDRLVATEIRLVPAGECGRKDTAAEAHSVKTEELDVLGTGKGDAGGRGR